MGRIHQTRESEQCSLVRTQRRARRIPARESPRVLGADEQPVGDVLEPAAREQCVESIHSAALQRRVEHLASAIGAQHGRVAIGERAPHGTRACAQRKVAEQVAAESMDRADARRIHFYRKVAPTGRAERRTQLALEIRCRLVGERDGGDLLERERRRHRRDPSTLSDDGHPQLMADRLDDRRRLAGTSAGVDEQMTTRLDDATLRVRERHHARWSLGPPGIRQTSRAGQ